MNLPSTIYISVSIRTSDVSILKYTCKMLLFSIDILILTSTLPEGGLFFVTKEPKWNSIILA